MQPLIAAICLTASLSITSHAHAQEAPSTARAGPPVSADSITVGVGIGVTTSYDGANDYDIIPGGALLGTVSGHDFRLNGLQLFVDAIPNNRQRAVEIELGPVAGLDFNRTGNVSDARIEALGELDTAIELGLRGAIGKRGIFNRTDQLSLAVTGVADVAGAHDSSVITPAVEYSTVLGRRIFLRASVSGDFVGDRWAVYNFGIDTSGADASGLAAYDPDGGLASIGTSILGTYSLSGRRTGWALFGIASFKRLQGDIAASPIVRETGSPDQFFGSIGLGYTF